MKVAEFMKVSYAEYQKYQGLTAYENLSLPKRMTKDSAGYDFYLPKDVIMEKKSTCLVPTGCKVKMKSGWVLLVFIRSGIALKHNLLLTNGVAVIDADYYNNEQNEGHIFLSLRNDSDLPVTLKAGQRICQGIFVKYGVGKDKTNKTRTGGFGSTD